MRCGRRGLRRRSGRNRRSTSGNGRRGRCCGGRCCGGRCCGGRCCGGRCCGGRCCGGRCCGGRWGGSRRDRCCGGRPGWQAWRRCRGWCCLHLARRTACHQPRSRGASRFDRRASCRSRRGDLPRLLGRDLLRTSGSWPGSGLLGRSGFGLRLGRFLDRDRTPQAFAVRLTADSVGLSVLDRRRMALDADPQGERQVERLLVRQAQFSCQLVEADLLRQRLLRSLSVSSVVASTRTCQ
jgi:hypothetical protein